MNDLDEELIQDFVGECAEHLDTIESALLAAEAEDDSFDVDEVFRAAHTIKGTAGFMGFAELERLTHRAENLLGALRENTLALDSDLIGLLLEVVDHARNITAAINDTGEEPELDLGSIVTRLESALHTGTMPGAGNDSDTAAAAEEPTEEVAEPATVTPNEVAAPEAEPVADNKSAVEAKAEPKRGKSSESSSGSTSDEKIRVSVAHLDQLMNLVGELVLARNQILQVSDSGLDAVFSSARDRINTITTDLQAATMTARMQPIGNAWSTLPRVVRDVSSVAEKKVRLDLVGKETELDKSLIEAIRDPITHIVRNSIDHGFEPPAERLEIGKPEQGHLRLEAYHEDGQVHIRITDDGRGIDPEKIRAAAVSKGLITEDRAATMSDGEAVELIMAPGFSTAEKVTNLSGRGVGMDVVKTGVESIGGVVSLSSEVGRGSEVKISIPLTLAIVPALTADAGGRRFAIPQQSLIELVRVPADQVSTLIEEIDDARFLRRRGRLLPVVDLAQVLDLEVDPELAKHRSLTIAVLNANGQEFGLSLETIRETVEIVVKPLGKFLAHLEAFAGATILGSGELALILNAGGIARMSAVLEDRGKSDIGAESEASAPVDGERMGLLVLDIADRRYALNLNDVERIELFESDTLEWSGDHRVVQYRGDLLKVVPLAAVVGGDPTMHGEELTAVVARSADGVSTAFVVDCIVDVVDEVVVVREIESAGQIARSVVLNGVVADLIDLSSAEAHVTVGQLV